MLGMCGSVATNTTGPPESQVGSYNRAIMLDLWELHSVALGMSEELIASLREVDELALPEVDVGLYIRSRTVWATKGGAHSGLKSRDQM